MDQPRSDADKLLDRLFEARDFEQVVRGSVRVGDTLLSGTVNGLSRSGENKVVISICLGRGLTLRWEGRRIQSKVIDLAPDIAAISDGGPRLELTIELD